jgi:hypothetical protein
MMINSQKQQQSTNEIRREEVASRRKKIIEIALDYRRLLREECRHGRKPAAGAGGKRGGGDLRRLTKSSVEKNGRQCNGSRRSSSFSLALYSC